MILLSRIFLCLVSIFFCTACLGGGTIGTGLGFNQNGQSSVNEAGTFTVHGRVLTLDGSPAANAVIQINGQIVARTDRGGSFAATLNHSDRRLIKIQISYNQRTSETMLPNSGRKEISLVFRLLGNGDVSLE